MMSIMGIGQSSTNNELIGIQWLLRFASVSHNNDYEMMP